MISLCLQLLIIALAQRGTLGPIAKLRHVLETFVKMGEIVKYRDQISRAPAFQATQELFNTKFVFKA